MGWASEYATIRAQFMDNWGGETIVAEENAAGEPTDQVAWIRFQVLGTDGRVAGIGGPQTRYRHDGDVVIEIFAPLNHGVGRSRELADKASSILRGLQVGGITFWAPRLIKVGPRGAWYRMNLICPFQRDEVFAY
jgi:hypothetical protein